MYDAKQSIEIEKTQHGFKLSTSANSSLKEFAGDYDWQAFSKLNWDGIYTNANYTIVLAQIDEQRLNITMNSKIEAWDAEATAYTTNEIIYNESRLGATQNLKIVKSAEGIQIESSSDNKDSVLNKINGTFQKIK